MLDINKLGKGIKHGNTLQFICPACFEEGSAQAGNPHLAVFNDGKFNCIKYSGDKLHNKRIIELAGLNDGSLLRAQVAEFNQLIATEKIYDKAILLKLLPLYDYFISRGITKETQKLFEIGLAMSGTCRKRFTAPIYNLKGQIHGFWARWHKDEVPENTPKYKLIGRKSNFIYPWHINKEDIIKNKNVILVESPVDVMYLHQNGVRTSLCLFGTSLSTHLLNYLISLNPNKIYISTNNEPENNNTGNNAAIKIKEKLDDFFDNSKIIIKLPTKKDFAEMTEKEILGWNNSP
ncbi:MAG: toprim domain-containing protein [Nanoarchaeota archaeon]